MNISLSEGVLCFPAIFFHMDDPGGKRPWVPYHQWIAQRRAMRDQPSRRPYNPPIHMPGRRDRYETRDREYWNQQMGLRQPRWEGRFFPRTQQQRARAAPALTRQNFYQRYGDDADWEQFQLDRRYREDDLADPRTFANLYEERAHRFYDPEDERVYLRPRDLVRLRDEDDALMAGDEDEVLEDVEDVRPTVARKRARIEEDAPDPPEPPEE